VDIIGCTIYRFDPRSGALQNWTTPQLVGFVTVTEHDYVLIAGLKSGLHHLTLQAGGEVEARCIDRVDNHLDHIRFNDGVADAQGNIWGCTMDMRCTDPAGCYYRYDRHFNRQTVAEGYVVANGPALSPCGALLYTVETAGSASLPKGIYVSQLKDKGSAENRHLLIDWRDRASLPDGIITDRSGNLWIGEFGGNTLRSYTPEGVLRLAMPLPAWNLTKAAFDTDQKNLYVTSALVDTDQAIIECFPDTGGLLVITGF
jgi:sugar lactone lactonase YvrE